MSQTTARVDGELRRASVSRVQVMVRNAVFLLSGNIATWGLSLLVWLVVPRVIGPAAWGEFNLGVAISSLAVSVGGFGIGTYLLKEIARDREGSEATLAAGLGVSVVLVVPITVAVILFTVVAQYSSHTRLVVVLVTLMGMATFLAAPAVSALQALEKMHINTLVNGLRTVASSAAIVATAWILRPDIIVLIVVALVVTLAAGIVQFAVTRRSIPLRLAIGHRSAWQLIRGGLPFWTNGVFLTVYVWIDTVLLSLLTSNHEVGFYAAPVQIVVTLGFLPALVSTVIFPSLARDFREDFERARRISRASLGGLVTIGIPISVGIALVGPQVVRLAFGPAFAPSEPVMVILALTIVPGYIATLAYWMLAAADRQRQWAYVMGIVAVVNPVINLVTISQFQRNTGHGSLGAAVALLITDAAVAAIGLALIPRELLRPLGPLLDTLGRAALATALMALPVWLLRDVFLPVPVLVGVAVFTTAGFASGLVRGYSYRGAWSDLSPRIFGRARRSAAVDVSAQRNY